LTKAKIVIYDEFIACIKIKGVLSIAESQEGEVGGTSCKVLTLHKKQK
jgi:hypothetical protein